MNTLRRCSAAMVLALAAASVARAQTPSGPADATVDLATRDGVAVFGAAWRYHDVALVPAAFHAPGPDNKPSGPPNTTLDIAPRADADDAAWEIIDPTTLPARRAGGRVCFAWYRTTLTLPARIGGVDVTGATLVFDIVVDDYAEVWVDGQLPRALGQSGGDLIAGWNAPNRVVIARDARPGQRVQIAVFGINGPISDAPANFIWVRSARVDVYASRVADARGRIERLRPALDAVIARDATIEKLADGFQFTEGPVWLPSNALLFSDPNTNVIYRWTPDGAVRVERTRSGFAGDDVSAYHQPGSNGLALDAQGRLTACQHGERRVVRFNEDGTTTVLADRFKGKRLNSPNDLVYRSDGTLYFTDPPFGLPRVYDDPSKELAWSGVYCVKNGVLRLLSTDLRGPNGLAFSPDEKFLYVTNWDTAHKVVMRYDVRRDGSLANGRVFADLTSAPGAEALDGIKVDATGTVFVSGPGGVWVISSGGTHLGTIVAPELPANMAWGDADTRTLYLTARTGLYRVRLLTSSGAVTALR